MKTYIHEDIKQKLRARRVPNVVIKHIEQHGDRKTAQKFPEWVDVIIRRVPEFTLSVDAMDITQALNPMLAWSWPAATFSDSLRLVGEQTNPVTVLGNPKIYESEAIQNAALEEPFLALTVCDNYLTAPTRYECQRRTGEL